MYIDKSSVESSRGRSVTVKLHKDVASEAKTVSMTTAP